MVIRVAQALEWLERSVPVDAREVPRLLLAVSPTISLSHHMLVDYMGTKCHKKLLLAGNAELRAFAAHLHAAALSDRTSGWQNVVLLTLCCVRVCLARVSNARNPQSVVRSVFYFFVSRSCAAPRTRAVVTQLPAVPTCMFPRAIRQMEMGAPSSANVFGSHADVQSAPKPSWCDASSSHSDSRRASGVSDFRTSPCSAF